MPCALNDSRVFEIVPVTLLPHLFPYTGIVLDILINLHVFPHLNYHGRQIAVLAVVHDSLHAVRVDVGGFHIPRVEGSAIPSVGSIGRKFSGEFNRAPILIASGLTAVLVATEPYLSAKKRPNNGCISNEYSY